MRDIFIVSLACLLAYSVFGEEREIASCDDLKAVIGEGLLTVAGETKLSFVDDTIKCNPGDHPTTVYVGAGHKLVLTDSGKDDEVTLTNVRYTVAGDDARLVVETRIAMKGITWPNGEDGAALSITTGEAVFQKRALFEDMKGSKNGGAVSVKTGGKLTFEDKVTFKRIESEVRREEFHKAFHDDDLLKADGGAIFLAESSATFKMDALFIDNKAWDHGGAMFLDDASTTFEGVAVLEGNKAHDDGGAIYLFDSSVATFEKEATFKGNEAQISGGAMFLVNASATFKVGSVLEGNEAEFEGGAICLRNDGSITFEGETEFEGNRAQRDGGAMSLRAASVTFSRKVVFEGNEAQVFGGALAMFLDSTCTFGDDISFMDNKAQGVDCTLEGRGGHVYAKDSGTAIVFEEETSAEFSGGKADIGGAIASFDGADVIIEGTAKFAGNVGRKCGDAIATDDTGTFTEAAGSQVSCSDNNTSGSTLPSKCQFGSKMLKSLGTEAPQHLLYKVS